MIQELPALPAFSFGSPILCTYCGDPPADRDHVIPVAFQRTHARQRFEANGPLTWACKSCNSRLHSQWFDSFDARCRWVRDRLNIKAKAVEWSNDEINRLGHSLQSYVRNDRAQRIWQRNRADWYESRDYWLNIENLQWAMSGFNPNNPGVKFLADYFRCSLGNVKQSLYR